MGEFPYIEFVSDFLEMTPRGQVTEEIIDLLDLLKM